MSTCSICGGQNTPEREAIGYTHCTTKSCVATWRNRRIQSAGLTLVNPHKQGLTWVRKSEDVVTNNGRRH